MGRFRLSGGPFWMYSWAILVLTWAVLVILKIYGPFWFTGRFGRFPLDSLLMFDVTFDDWVVAFSTVIKLSVNANLPPGLCCTNVTTQSV